MYCVEAKIKFDPIFFFCFSSLPPLLLFWLAFYFIFKIQTLSGIGSTFCICIFIFVYLLIICLALDEVTQL